MQATWKVCSTDMPFHVYSYWISASNRFPSPVSCTVMGCSCYELSKYYLVRNLVGGVIGKPVKSSHIAIGDF